MKDRPNPRVEPDADDPLVPAPDVRLTGQALGIDIGGTEIKGAIVDLAEGRLLSDRAVVPTPRPSTPDSVLDAVAGLCEQLVSASALTADMPAGIGFPSVIKHGRPMTAANIDPTWIGQPIERLLRERLGRPVLVLNDADAAGVAEVTHGAGRGHEGVILLLTLGTGIGSALFVDGRLVPNLELGHLEYQGQDVETLLSGSARERRGLDWETYGRELAAFLRQMDAWFWPDLFILGGGVSAALDRYGAYLDVRPPLVAAAMLNRAGIVGAALAGAYAAQHAS
ncbi:MAG TPA: ROK family protein [Candidatus Limnocylindrales bacterium]|nr:ROK family protein [Candidatus Limnocylindrales bacterium]